MHIKVKIYIYNYYNKFYITYNNNNVNNNTCFYNYLLIK